MCFTPNLKGKQAEIAEKSHFWGHQKSLMLNKFSKTGPKYQKFYFSLEYYLNSGKTDFGTSKHIPGFRNQNHFQKSAQASANWGV